MDEEASEFGLRVSWTKTEIQNLGSGPTPSPIIVDGNTVDPVEEFTYLGSIQSSKSNSGPEYIWRIGLSASALKRLDCVWSQSKLSITTKLRIYSTCVLPILLYASEAWTLIQTDWNKLDSFHVGLRCQRRILHIRWHNFVSNDEVLHRTGLFDVSYIVRKRRLGLFEHVARLRRDVPANQILYKSAPSRGMVSGLHRSGDAPVADRRPPVPDLPRHGCNSDRGPAASGGPTVLANDRNGGRLRLNASRHDDDDDEV